MSADPLPLCGSPSSKQKANDIIDDKKIWVFTPLTVSGVHSPSWNKLALGIEMLGNYAKDDFSTGRGRAVRKNAIAAMATLCAVLGIDPATLRLHKEDTETDHKGCPGNNVRKSEVIAEITALVRGRHGGGHSVAHRELDRENGR